MSESLFDSPALGIYEKQQYIPFRDCDALERVGLNTWLSLLAETAGEQYEARNLGRNALLSQNQVFLVSRFSLRVLRHPRAYETLTARTWERGTDAVFFRRCYDFSDESGETVAQAASLWLLCDPVRHRILRPAQMGRPVLDVDRPIDCPFPERILPPDGAETLGTRRVVFSDLDANRHVYCANYGRFFMDGLPEAYRQRPFRTFTINYVKEAVLGEELTLTGLGDMAGYTMTGLHEDGGACFTARMTF